MKKIIAIAVAIAILVPNVVFADDTIKVEIASTTGEIVVAFMSFPTGTDCNVTDCGEVTDDTESFTLEEGTERTAVTFDVTDVDLMVCWKGLSTPNGIEIESDTEFMWMKWDENGEDMSKASEVLKISIVRNSEVLTCYHLTW